MKIALIRPEHTDFAEQLARLKPSFATLADAEAQFAHCVELVTEKRASFYHLTGEGVSLRFVGLVENDTDYFVLALAGKNLRAGLPVFIDAVKSQGYARICGQVTRTGLDRIYTRAGFRVLEDEGGVRQLVLDLRGK